MRIRVQLNDAGFERLRTATGALRLSEGDYAGPVLRAFDAVHRKQVKQAFTTQGASTPGGRWAPLNVRYAARKRIAAPGKKILTLTGETARRFTLAKYPGHIARHIGKGRFEFGAVSSVAAAHAAGNPLLARQRVGPTRASSIFGGIAPRLPVRDMILKTAAQVAEFTQALTVFYLKRVDQVKRFSRRRR